MDSEQKRFVMKAETGQFRMTGQSVGLSIIRGDLSITYFWVVFGILVTMILGFISFFPEEEVTLSLKAVSSLILIGIAFYLSFFNDSFKNAIF